MYIFWLQNYIYPLLNFVKPRTLIPSKHCIVFFANREKKNISAKYYRNKEGGHLVAGYHSQQMSASQCSKKAGIHCLHEYLNFSLFISTAWLNSLLNKATHDTCDLHNHTSPKQPCRKKNLDWKLWKLERVVYLAMETDVDRDTCSLINWKLHQATGHLTITCARGRERKGLWYLEILG